MSASLGLSCSLLLLAGELAAQSFGPVDVGTTVNGFQDDFNGTLLGASWTVRGANVYSVSGGVLHLASPGTDPNHLLYELPGYDNSTQEVLARMRVKGFTPSIYSRGGVAVGVAPATSYGINFTFRGVNGEGQNGRHTAMLDDFRAWGPGQNFVWQNDAWYWLRLRQEPNAASQGGANDVFAKIWLADGSVPEPASWQLTWNYTPAQSTRTGFAGLLAGSSQGTDGYSEFDVDYVLIKASGLPAIVVAPSGFVETPVTITNQPQSPSVMEAASATFIVGAFGFPLPIYQWFKNGAAVPGATNPLYSIASVPLSDSGAQVRVVAANTVSGIMHYATSSIATLTVIADTNPPALLSARSVGLDAVQVIFSEPVTPASATDLAHYAITGATGGVAILGAVLDATQTNLLLSVNAMVARAVYALTVSGIADRSAAENLLPQASASFVANPLSVTITEFLAANATGLTDEDGAHSDWIEMQNQTAFTVNLSGWRLTDDPLNLAKWTFPATVLQPSQFLVVFASGADRRIAGGELHTNFKLDSNGEYLALVRPDGIIVQEFLFGPQREDVSFGMVGFTNLFMLIPTPGTSNGPGVVDFVADTKFNPNRGFFSNAFSLSLTTATAGAEIWFTVNGSLPAPNAPDSTLYVDPLVISNTTTMRAASFLTGYAPTHVDTHTFIFLPGTARQPANPPGFPSTWAGFGADYAMDQSIVTNALPPYDITNALLSLPAISLVAPPEDVFGAAQGIYYNSSEQGLAWERAASIELIFPGGTPGFQNEAGLRIHGYSSRGHGFTLKHSFHLNFRKEYGPSRLHFPLFVDTSVADFDQIVLRACSTDSYPVNDINLSRWNARRATYIRDQWLRDAMRDLGHPTPHGRYVHLWLNGLYWGLYNVAELPGDDFAASYFGGSKLDYDVLKDYLIVDGGDAQKWNELQTLVSPGVASESLYQQIQGNNPDGTRNTNYPVYLNLPAYVDYMIIHINAGAEDWPNNNWWSCRQRGPDSDGFHFVPWDQEISNESLTRTVNAWGEPFEQVKTIDRAGYFYDRLRGYENFRQLFMDRVWFAVAGNGPLAPAPSAARWLARQSEIDLAMVAETARWGDSSHLPASTRSNWLNEMGFVAGYWASNQVRAIQRFRNVNLWPVLGPPTFSQASGYFTSSVVVGMAHTNLPGGAIWFTVDGSDPRAAAGLPSANAQNYSSALTLTNSTRIRARVTDGINWSPPMEAIFLPIQALTNLVVTEVYYNPPSDGVVSGDAFEFIELQNRGAFTLDLSAVHFTAGIGFTFTNGTTLAPGAFVVLARDATNFAARFPGVPLYGLYTGKLDNAGETLALADPLGGIVFNFAYDDAVPWPANADGFGDSLQRVNFSSSASNSAQWAAAPPNPGTSSPLSVLKFDSLTIGAAVTFTFQAPSNTSYAVQFTSALGAMPWVTLTNIAGRPSNHVVVIAELLVAPHRFYRVVSPQQ